MGKKRLFIVVLLTAVTLFFLKNLYIIEYASDENIGKNARIDIFFAGDKDNQIFWEENANKQMKFQRPSWFKNPKWLPEPGNGIVIEYPISDNWKKDVIQLKLQGKGTLKLYFRAQDYKNVQIKYKNAIINGKDIFSGTKFVSFKNFYSFNEENASQYITLSIQSSQIKTQYDFAIFFSLLILCFIFYYKIIQYLAKFKITEHNSRIDIVFLSVFFALLMIPMLHINQDEKSYQENRMLAKYVPLIDNQGHLNLKYGKNFEAWFNDRFNFRNNIIRFYNTLQYSLSQYFSGKWTAREIYFAKDGWMFDNEETRRFLGFNQVQTDKTVQNFKKLKNFMEQSGIKFYFFISPTKGDIYAEYNIRYLLEKDKTEELVNIISKNSGVEIYYPRQKYLEAKESEMIFYKTDHHSTENATWIAYQDLSAQIKHDFPEYHIMSLDDYTFEYDNMVHFETHIHQGVSAERINVDVSNLLDTQYKYFVPHNQDNITTNKVSRYIYDYSYNNKAPNNLKIMLIGNSFTENFVKFIPYSVKEMRKYRTNNIGLQIKIIESEIKKYNPDIVIFALHSSWINNLYTMY